MKKFYFLLLALCFITSAQAQIINFPDANFKAKLLQADETNGIAQNASYTNIRIDTNGDGEIDVAEVFVVSILNITNSNISSLSGIEYFSNLKYLNCSMNQLTFLDVSSLNNLDRLNCSDNQLTSVNLTGASNLNTLTCSNNQLTSIDVSGLMLTQFNCINFT